MNWFYTIGILFIIGMLFPYLAIPVIIALLLIDTLIFLYNRRYVKVRVRYLLIRLWRYTFKNDRHTKRLPPPK